MARNSARKPATSQRKKWLQKLQQSAARNVSGNRQTSKLVLDTNIWYSAIVYGGSSEAVVDHCLEKNTVVASEELVRELLDRLKRKTRAPYRWLRQLRLTLQKAILIVPTGQLPDRLRDPKDEHVIAAAMLENCELIVTGDKYLLGLDSYKGILIISPADFLELMSE